MEYNNLPTTSDFCRIILENCEHPITSDELFSIAVKKLNISKDVLAIRNPSGSPKVKKRFRQALNILVNKSRVTKLDDGKYVGTSPYKGPISNLDTNDIIQFNKNKESTESYAKNITIEKLTSMEKIDSACSEWNEDLKLKLENRIFGESTSSLEKIVFAFLCKTGQIVGCPAINETHYIDFCRKKFVDLMIKNEIGIKPSYIVNDIDEDFL